MSMNFDPNPYASSSASHWSQPPSGGPRELSHTGFGIASFLIALATGAIDVVTLVVAGVMESSRPGGMDEESTGAIMIGLVIFAGWALNGLGLVLGLVGLFQADRKRLFAILGLVFNILIALFFLGLIIIGLAMG